MNFTLQLKTYFIVRATAIYRWCIIASYLLENNITDRAFLTTTKVAIDTQKNNRMCRLFEAWSNI